MKINLRAVDYNNNDSLSAINDVATMKLKNDGRLPEEIKNEWLAFVNILRGNLRMKPLDDSRSPIGVAFQDLMEALYCA